MNLRPICLTLLALASVSASAEYKGTVFNDKNANGIMDKGEKPLSGIKVTDGLNVVVTDSKGNFTLPGYDRPRFIYITTPSGFKTFNRHYIPVSDETKTYDFALIPYDTKAGKNGAHKFIHITDTEIFNTSGNERWVEDLRRYSDNEGAAFIVHTGDICYIKGLNEHIKLMNTENMGIPVYYTIGNHDLVAGDYGEQLFESLYGPVYYSFDVEGTHYVVTPMPGGDHRPSYTKDQVAAWMENDLANMKPGTPLVVFNHDLYTPENMFNYGGKEKTVNLNDHNLKAWVYGHVHTNHKRKQGDVYTFCTSTPDKGGIDHSTSAYRVVSVDNAGKIDTRLRYAYIDNSVAVASPSGNTSAAEIIVNAYSAQSETVSVTYSCSYGGKEIIKNKPLSRLTDFSWGAPLKVSDEYKGKELTITATASFNSGEKATASNKFTIGNSVPAITPGANWDNLAGNASHSANNTAATLDSTLTLAWASNVGGNIFMTSPLIHNGRVFTATVDEDMTGEGAITALDINTGRIAWKFPVEASIKNTIAIDGDIVFGQDVNGTLYAVGCNDGQLRWKAQMPVSAVPPLIEGLATDNGIVYAGTGKGMSAFKAADGKLLWRNTEWGQSEGTTSTLSVGDGVVVGAVQWTALFGNDAETGKLLWKLSDYGLRNRGASAAIHNGLIYMVSDKSFFIIEAKSGRIIARKEMPVGVDATSTPLITDRHLIFGTSNDGVMAIDNQTFETAWTCRLSDAMIYTVPYTRPESSSVETTPVLAGGIVWVAASDGSVYGIKENEGRICFRYSTGAPLFSSVAVSGNCLVASDFGGNVYLFTSGK